MSVACWTADCGFESRRTCHLANSSANVRDLRNSLLTMLGRVSPAVEANPARPVNTRWRICGDGFRLLLPGSLMLTRWLSRQVAGRDKLPLVGYRPLYQTQPCTLPEIMQFGPIEAVRHQPGVNEKGVQLVPGPEKKFPSLHCCRAHRLFLVLRVVAVPARGTPVESRFERPSGTGRRGPAVARDMLSIR